MADTKYVALKTFNGHAAGLYGVIYAGQDVVGGDADFLKRLSEGDDPTIAAASSKEGKAAAEQAAPGNVGGPENNPNAEKAPAKQEDAAK